MVADEGLFTFVTKKPVRMTDTARERIEVAAGIAAQRVERIHRVTCPPQPAKLAL